MSGRFGDQSEWEMGAGLAEKVGKWARHLAAVANEGAAYRGAVGPTANGRRCECAGSLFELAAAADGGWRRVAPTVRGHRGRGMRVARSGTGVSGTCEASGPQRCSGARQDAGRAPWAGRSPRPAGTCRLVRREAVAVPRPVLSCPRPPPCRGLGNLPGWFLGREMGNVGGVYCPFLATTNIFWLVGILRLSGFPQMVERSFLNVILWGY